MFTPISVIFFYPRVIQEKRGEIRQSRLQMQYIRIGDIECLPRFSVIFFYQRVIQEKRGEFSLVYSNLFYSKKNLKWLLVVKLVDG